jgi:hypothetical protein
VKSALRNLGESKPKPAKTTPVGRSTTGQPLEYGEECGGKGGVPYLIVLQPGSRLRKITIWHRDYVDGIQLQTDHGVLPRIGGTGKHHDVRTDIVELAPDEFLMGISVEFWQYIDRLTFHTNHRNFGPYGGHDGLLKKTIMGPPDRAVVGFKGRHWELVDSIQLMVL